MIRLASALILIGCIPAAQVLLDSTGPNAIRFTFFGMPCILVGMALYALIRLRRARSPD
jgi:hypothetical protein